jgi:cytochrome c oxidase assembly protein subunit 15
MSATSTLSEPRGDRSGTRHSAALRLWIIVLAILIVIMIAVGGATRLTGSGLSITEWRPVTGAIPPLSHDAWLAEFEKYRQIPQYELLNKGMSLGEFKVIYAWEWGHRQLGRFIGLTFLLPFLWFWWRGTLHRGQALALLGIGALGGLQGAIGWIMVASGLEPGMVAVAPLKLMLHLVTASLILACLAWMAAGLVETSEPRSVGEARLQSGSTFLAVLVLVQIALGALVAGSRAGLTYNTWPLMDGELIPPFSALFAVTPWIENFVDNVMLVQFNHRLVAYVLVAAALWHAVRGSRIAAGTAAAARAQVLAGLCVAQSALGIVTLLLVVPLWAGLLHQVVAMAVLATAVSHARLTRPLKSEPEKGTRQVLGAPA